MSNHPLVGKEIVDTVTGPGQVTKILIENTLADVEFYPDDACAFLIMGSKKFSWKVFYNDKNIITEVKRD